MAEPLDCADGGPSEEDLDSRRRTSSALCGLRDDGGANFLMRTDLPAWLAKLLRRRGDSGVDSTYAVFRFNLNREYILSQADANENGRELLRSAALTQLSSSDPHLVERALICLAAVGKKSDARLIESAKAHGDINVQKSAAICLFEIRKNE